MFVMVKRAPTLQYEPVMGFQSAVPGVFDLAVVAGAIIGLSCARAAALKGLRVVVIDRDSQSSGASVRNFGFITVTGQERGAAWTRARRVVIHRPRCRMGMGEECKLLSRA